MNNQQITKIEVYGKKWFQRSYGNTYNTAQIFVDGVCVANLDRAYGYGDYYVQRAGQFLHEEHYIELERYNNGSVQSLLNYCNENGIELVYSVEDVKRQRDL